jgi:hypothetical protein
LSEITLFIRNIPIVRVLESFNGDLYFISEEKGDEIFCYARLYSMPQFAEWGYNSLTELRKGYGRNKLWDVPRRNWPNLISYNVAGLVVL